MKKLLAVLVCLWAFNASAQLGTTSVESAGFAELSESDKAEVIKHVADKAAQGKTLIQAVTSKPAAEHVDQWLNIGERIGMMIGGAAKEVGLAVNDFVKTPVGLTAMGLIVWHFIGNMIVHVFGGLLVLVVGFGAIWFFARRYTNETITYDPERTDLFGRSRKLTSKRSAWDAGDIGGFMVASLIVLVASLATMFSF